MLYQEVVASALKSLDRVQVSTDEHWHAICDLLVNAGKCHLGLTLRSQAD